MALNNPFRELASLQQQMDRLFNDRWGVARTGESLGWTPACSVYEDEESVVLRFDLPGVDAKDVDVRFDNGTLTVRGDRKLEREDRRQNYQRLEQSYGAFSRSFSLPGTLDPERIQADMKNGVLSLLLPKRAEARPKSIQVKVNG